MVSGIVAETDKNEVVPSLQRYTGNTDESVISVVLRGPLFYLTGNYGLGMLLLLAMLTSMRPVTETLEDSSR